MEAVTAASPRCEPDWLGWDPSWGRGHWERMEGCRGQGGARAGFVGPNTQQEPRNLCPASHAASFEQGHALSFCFP